MVRSLTSAASTEINTPLGIEPIILVRIDWGSSIQWYADKDFSSYPAKIIDISGLDSTVKIGSVGNAGSLDLTLDDIDGSIKTIFNTQDIHKKSCQVYQVFENLIDADKFLLFDGEISSPIVWSEKNRTVNLSILSKVENKEIGFSPEKGDFDFVANEIIGKTWPICFGKPILVPGVKISDQITGQSLSKYVLITKDDLNSLADSAISLAQIAIEKEKIRNKITQLVKEHNLIVKDKRKDISTAKKNKGLTKEVKALTIMTNVLALEKLTETFRTDLKELEDDLRNSTDEETSTLVDLSTQKDVMSSDTNILITELERYIDLRLSLENANKRLEILDSEIKDLEDIELDTSQALLTATENFGKEIGKIGTPDFDLQTLLKTIEIVTNINQDLLEVRTRLASKRQNKIDLTNSKILLDSRLTIFSNILLAIRLKSIFVTNGEDFPQGQFIEVLVNGNKMRGFFTGSLFSITDPDVPVYRNIKISGRENDVINTFWISNIDTTIDLVNKYCLIKDSNPPFPDNEEASDSDLFGNIWRYRIVFVTDQIEDTLHSKFECVYEPVVWDFGAFSTTETSDLIASYNRFIFDGHGQLIIKASPFLLNEMIAKLNPIHPSFVTGLNKDLPSNQWEINIGDSITLSTSFQDKYVVNQFPSNNILEVFGLRRLRNKQTLLPIPSQYYNFNLNFPLAGSNTTILEFRKPLKDYSEGWSDNIFATVDSTLPSNSADVIKWVIENYTAHTIDAASFADVATKLTNYPVNFALLSTEDAMKFAEDIAWQSRCTIWVANNIVFIKYLAEEKTPVSTFTESDIDVASMEVTTTDTESLITVLDTTWRKNYAQKQDFHFIVRNNIPIYGTIKLEKEIFIYNNLSSVEKSATFWLIRYSNTWKRMQFSTPLQKLNIEVLDTILLNFMTNYVSTGSVPAIVESILYDSDNQTLRFDVWIPIKLGEMSKYVFAWPSTAAQLEQYPTLTDLFAGG